MSLAITQIPIAYIDANNVSKWNAAFSPIIYKGQRKDKPVYSVKEYSTSSAEVSWNYGASIPDFVVGSYIYLNSGKYNDVYKILSVLSTTIVIDANLGASTGGFINYNSFRKNYHINIELYRIIDREYIKISDAIFRPLPNGQFTFDFSSMLQRYISFQNTFDYDVINESDLNISGGFNFRMKETWQSSNNNWSNFSEKDITYFTGSSKQLREQYGSNMALYVPIINSIGIYNGDFNNEYGWTESGSGSDIMFRRGYYWIGAGGGTKTVTNNLTAIISGTSYDIILKIKTLQNAKVTLLCGTQAGDEITTVGVHKQTIVSNGTSFSIKIDSIGGSPHRAILEYVTLSLSENTHLAKFLMDDFEPTLFAGYPFDLSFILSDNVQSLKLNRIRNFLDINKTTISSDTTALDITSNTFAINRLLIEPITSDIPSGTKYIDCYIEAGNDVKEVNVYEQGTMEGMVFNVSTELLQKGNNADLLIRQ